MKGSLEAVWLQSSSLTEDIKARGDKGVHLRGYSELITEDPQPLSFQSPREYNSESRTKNPGIG